MTHHPTLPRAQPRHSLPLVTPYCVGRVVVVGWRASQLMVYFRLAVPEVTVQKHVV